MQTYPFDDEKAYLDRQTFAAFSRYFPLRPRPAVEEGDNDGYQRAYDLGHGVFEFKNGWNVLANMPIDELCTLSPFLFAQGPYGIHVIDWREPESFKTTKVLDIMKQRGITPDIFLQYMGTFEFDAIGPETGQMIAAIINDLDPRSGHGETNFMDGHYRSSQKRYAETKEKLKHINRADKAPFTLEAILSFEHKPTCLRYADDGRLYVLDEKGELHEFTEGQKTNQWKLWLEDCDLGRHNMMLGDLQVFPNMAVTDGYAFVANGDMVLRRFNLTKPKRFEGKNVSDAKCSTEHQGRNLIHDVVLRDGNVIVSMSDRHASYRYIGQWVEEEVKIKIVYEGKYPISRMRSTGADYTLRLDVHKGQLFFPRGNGMSLYKGFGSTGQEPKEMIEEYARAKKSYGVTSPLSKFSFGDNFMVAQAHLKKFELPMLCIFRPRYKTETTEIIPTAFSPPPNRLELEHVCYPPRFTGETIMNASISAHRNAFAMTNSSFKRVYVYRVDEEKKI